MVNTLSSRVLGRHLRELREQAGLTNGYVADQMEYSTAKLSRQEHGTHSVSVHELSHLVTNIYRCGAETLDRLEALRQQAARGRGWWVEHAKDIPWHMQVYLEAEEAAERIDTFSCDVIPGLLQTAEYSLLQERMFGLDMASVERTAWLRTQRQARFYELSNKTVLDVILCEGSLRRCVGSGQFGQLDSLVERSELPRISIRIIPDSAGIHGVTAHYTVMTLPSGMFGPVMYLEYLGGSILVEDEQAVARTLSRHRSLPALDPDGSRIFLKNFIVQNRSGQLGTAVA